MGVGWLSPKNGCNVSRRGAANPEQLREGGDILETGQKHRALGEESPPHSALLLSLSSSFSLPPWLPRLLVPPLRAQDTHFQTRKKPDPLSGPFPLWTSPPSPISVLGTCLKAASDMDDFAQHDEDDPLTQHNTNVDEDPYARLKRAFVNERACPEILQYEESLVAEAVEHVDMQQAELDDRRASAATAEAGRDSSASDDLVDLLKTMELDRVKCAFFSLVFASLRIWLVFCH